MFTCMRESTAGVFGWSPEVWTAIGTLSLATVTALALLSAPLRRWRDRARLRMEILKEPPDTHMIDMANPLTGVFVTKALYVRVRVNHERGNAAENAELLAAALWEIDSSGQKKAVSSFLPLNLKWSHVGGVTIRVPRRLFRHCDLGHFQPVGNQTVFILDTIVQPNPVGTGTAPNVLFPGTTYEIELRLSGDNTKTIAGRWRISFGSGWSDDEKTMLGRVQITPA